MSRFEARRISDPVHGTVGLSDLEFGVINTRPFQRLRHIKQLGLGHYVFPGADYSRFAHSIGVCHVAGRVLQALREYAVHDLTDDEIQLYRLAALLHDVGHYPFSHAMEEAIENAYSGRLIEAAQGSEDPAKFFKHERVSEEIVLRDPELQGVLKTFDPAKVAAIFTREEPPRFANLVSSDLDADRIDYLVRTAHHTGLPYGNVDLDYIISQMRIDDSQRICLTSKAVRAADHFLLSRFFDYQQVAYHKTVAGLELVLKDVLQLLILSGRIDGTAATVSKLIANQSWADYDDAWAVTAMKRTASQARTDEILKNKIDALLHRNPPALICEREYIAERSDSEKRAFRLLRRSVKEHLPKWAEQAGIDPRYWYVWERGGMALTKIGGSVPVSAVSDPDEEDEEALEQAIRILSPNSLTSTPIVQMENSLMKNLSGSALYVIRVYVMLDSNDRDERSKRKDHIRELIRKDLPEAGWK